MLVLPAALIVLVLAAWLASDHRPRPTLVVPFGRERRRRRVLRALARLDRR